MATTANASQWAVRYVLEASWGAGPPGAASGILRATGFSPNDEADQYISEERRTDGQIMVARRGVVMARPSVDFELAYLAFKDMVRAFLRYDTTAGAGVGTSTTTTTFTAATKTIGRTGGSFITDGFLAGAKVRISGAAQAGNNAVFTLVTVGALAMTVSETLTEEAASNNVSITQNYAANGTTDSSFALEGAATDESLYWRGVGCVPTSLNLSIPLTGFVTGSLGFVAKAGSWTTEIAAVPTDVDTKDPVYSGDANSSIEEGGSAIVIAQGMDINMDWGYGDTRAVGSAAINEVFPGRLNCSGSLAVLFQAVTHYEKFLNGTESTLRAIMADGAGNAFDIYFPRVLYTAASLPVQGDDALVATLNWQAMRDATTGLTVLVNMLPAS